VGWDEVKMRASPALSARVKFGDMAGRSEARGPAADGSSRRLVWASDPRPSFPFFCVSFFFVFLVFIIIFSIFISLLVLVCLNFF